MYDPLERNFYDQRLPLETPDLDRARTDVLTRRLWAYQRVRLPSASGFMTTGRRTRSEVADEAMEVALRVGASPGMPHGLA